MSTQERELLGRLLQQSILTLCRETLTSLHRFDVDGIVCVTLQDASPIVVKVHEQVKADQHSLRLRLHQDGAGHGDARSLLARELTSALNRSAPSPLLDGGGEGEGQDGGKRLHGADACPLSSSSPSLEDDGPGMESSDEDASARSFGLSPPSDASQSRQLAEMDLPEDLSKTSLEGDRKPDADVLSHGAPSSGGKPSVSAVFDVKRETCSSSVETEMETASAKGSPADSGTPGDDSNADTPSGLSNGSGHLGFDGSSGVQADRGGVKCPKCLQVFENVEAFDAHNLRDHALFTCRICYRGFTARNNLKRHIRLHTGVKPFKCPMCSHAFSRKDDLKGHVLRHSYSKPFRCSLCSKGYTDRSCVRNHMAKEHGVRLLHVCPQCGEGFSDPKLYTEHKKLHPEFRSFRCKHCNFIGINALMHMKHLLTHEERTFVCSPCSHTFTDPFEYTEHLKQHRGDEEFRSYVCCFCNTVLASHEQFLRHEYTHAQGKAHSCHVCLKVFRFPSNLKEHLETHVDSNMKEHLSPHPSSSLTEHLPAHASAENVSTQYYCTECQVGFESEDSLQEHIFQAHEMQQQSLNDVEAGDDDSMSPEDLSMSHSSVQDDSKKSPSAPPPPLRSLLNGDSILKRTLQGAALVSPPPPQSAHIDLNQTKVLLLMQARKRQEMSSDSNGTGHIDLSQTRAPLLSLLEGRRESLRRHSQPRREECSQVQTATFSINGDTLKIKREPLSEEEEEGAEEEVGEDENSFSGFNGGEERLSLALRPLQNGTTEADSDKEVPDSGKVSLADGGGDRAGDVAIERMHIRAPGFERVVTPDVLFRDRTSLSCQQCGSVFSGFAAFEAHSSEQHRRFVCEYCGKSFTAKPNRDRHVRYHTGVRPYRCQLCDMSFFRGDDLKYHRTTRHTSIRR